ncbi:hypothetical protein SteCoe_18893 [Stentor coeruleus]|uniref:Uncharacterized protein n=1 Tax=Stentor coeruleus TaxID=5963 RepID=A0A1R2BW19_9CILI|nr:hypothetical protein SteCoe_18893 [Stentor coeruleus]
MSIPPPSTKKILTEELTRLKSGISGSQTLETYMALEEQHLDLKNFYERGQAEERYQQGFQDFYKKRAYEIPENLLSIYQNSGDHSVLSGILPEIYRVWYSYDNIIYFWDYSNSNAYTQYPVAEDMVVNVSLVPKNSDLFTNRVRFMLLIVTKNQINFVGVSLDPEFRLIEADVKAITDEIPIQSVTVLKDGRVIMGGADGSISELKYSNSSWFTSTKRYKRCEISGGFFSIFVPKFMKNLSSQTVTQLTVDNSRNILYALIKSSLGKYRIEAYDLGINEKTSKRICKITSSQMLKRLKELNQRMYSLHPDRLEIVHIEALSKTLTTDYHLLAVTKNGIRVFFVIIELMIYSYSQDQMQDFKPIEDFTLYIKFPPAAVKFSEGLDLSPCVLGNTSDKPTSFEKCFMTETGNFVLLEQSDRSSRFLCISRSMSRIALLQTELNRASNEYEETVTCFAELADTGIQHIQEVKAYQKLNSAISQLCNYTPRSEFRYKNPTRNLDCSSGCLSYECLPNLSNVLYRPPSDLLILTSRQLLEFTEIRPIDLLYQILVTSDDKGKIAEFSQSFGILHTCILLLTMLIGPVVIINGQETIISPVPESEYQKAKHYFKELGNYKNIDNSLHSLKLDDPMMCLADHKALYVYLSRILRPVWEENLSFSEGDLQNQIEQFQPAQLLEVKTRLEKFRFFVCREYTESTKKNGSSVYNLVEFTKRNEDALELLSLISQDFSFRRVVNELIDEDKELLMNISYRKFVSTPQGHNLAKALIEAYILTLRNPRSARQKRPNLMETLKDLTGKCSSFFNSVDSEIYIARECLYKALSTDTTSNRDELIEEALKHLIHNAASVGLGKVLYDLKQLRCYRWIICICIQKSIDINEIKGQDGKEEINECYELLTRILSDLKDSIQGVPSCIWFEKIPNEMLYEIKDEIVNEFCRHQDKNIHRILFQWLLECNLTTEILQIDSPFIKTFIEESLKNNSLGDSELLAKYCLKMNDYINSYKEFDKLASAKNSDILIEDRIKYLETCSFCLEKHIETFTGTSEEKKIFDQERENLKAKKNLARIQNNIKQVLRSMGVNQSKISSLDIELIQVNDMFENYCKKYNLYISQFEILDYIYNYTQMDKREVINSMKSTFIPIINECAELSWPGVLCERLSDLGKKYPYAFNTELVIKKVESLNLIKNCESTWLISLLVSLPIPEGFAEIWTIYYSHWKSSFNEPSLLCFFSIRCECLIRLWFSELKKHIIETDIWDKQSRDKAPKEKFVEKLDELKEFFVESKEIGIYISPDKASKILIALGTLEKNLNSLKTELMTGDMDSKRLRRRINFDNTEMSGVSERSISKDQESSRVVKISKSIFK